MPSSATVAPSATACGAPAAATGAWLAGVPSGSQTSNSASPTLPVRALTCVTVNRTHVTVRAGKSYAVAAPALSSGPTASVVPSLKRSVPARIWSSEFGRS